MSCDYDHGDLSFAAFLDGELLTVWGVEWWNDDYEVKKNFDMTVMPATDKEIYDDISPLNSSSMVDDRKNAVAYALFDYIYSGRMKAGQHKLTIKCYSAETIPMDVTYVNTTEFHKQWPAIAEETIDFNLTTDGLNKLIASSSAKKLSHAGGEWASVDSHLKATIGNSLPDVEIIDVACYTEWKVTLDYYGTPLYRDCKADIIYNNTKEYGCRLLRSCGIREDYNGSGYGKPYTTEVLNTYVYTGSITLLNNMHVPMPLSRVK
jgi:hypothetical protein